MPLNAPSPPSNDSLIELDPIRPDRRLPFYIAKSWLLWLQDALVTRIEQAPAIRTAVVLTNQSASIGATPMPLSGITAGRWRISWYTRITTVDAVNSSLTVTIGWTESAIALTISGAAITGNLVTSVQSGSVVIESDANAPINYATTAVSNTPGQMHYRLSLVAEAL